MSLKPGKSELGRLLPVQCAGESEAHPASLRHLCLPADPAVLTLAAVPRERDGVLAHVGTELRRHIF